MLVVAILESMWDWRSLTSGAGYNQAPSYFRINPQNHSGKRLYRIVGDNHLLVTNACRELVGGPNQHGKPDPEWLRGNLMKLDKLGIGILLVCGNVAQQTYEKSGFLWKGPTIRMMHPASRTWSNELLDAYSVIVRRIAARKALST
jgi:hypothetical protein